MEQEIKHLTALWQSHTAGRSTGGVQMEDFLSASQLKGLDRFDRAQLAEVVRVCRGTPTLSEAGRVLFASSRRVRKVANDADRLRKYLARFDLDWEGIRGGRGGMGTRGYITSRQGWSPVAVHSRRAPGDLFSHLSGFRSERTAP